MKTKDFIKMLQEADPSGEAYIRMQGGVPHCAELKEGYWDGPFQYIDDDGNFVTSIKEFKVDIHCIDILKFNPSLKYDYIICTLPFNAFPNGLVKDLQNQLKTFSHERTHFSYVEYMVLSYLRRSFAQNGYKAIQLTEHKKIVDDFKNRYLVQTVKVFKNIPPLYVHHLKF